MEKYKFCQNCGRKVSMNTKFCPYCGHKVETAPNTNDSNNKSDTEHINNQSKNTQDNKINGVGNGVKVPPNQPDAPQMSMSEQTAITERRNQQAMASLNLEQQNYVNIKVASKSLNTGIAYILWFLFWPFGGQHFYTHNKVAGIISLVIGILLDWVFIGLIINGIWGLVDLFIMPMEIKNYEARIRQKAIQELQLHQ